MVYFLDSFSKRRPFNFKNKKVTPNSPFRMTKHNSVGLSKGLGMVQGICLLRLCLLWNLYHHIPSLCVFTRPKLHDFFIVENVSVGGIAFKGSAYAVGDVAELGQEGGFMSFQNGRVDLFFPPNSFAEISHVQGIQQFSGAYFFTRVERRIDFHFRHQCIGSVKDLVLLEPGYTMVPFSP